jgi:hypothetical protein
VVYAGFWRRLGAWLIDCFPTVAIAGLIGIILGLLVPFFGVVLAVIAGLLLPWFYYAFMESSRQQATLGKMAIGIKVTDLRGNRISFARASGRDFGNVPIGLTPKGAPGSVATCRAPRFRERLPSSSPSSRRKRRAASTSGWRGGRTGWAVGGGDSGAPTCCRSGGFGSARVAGDRLPRPRGRYCTGPACR